METDIKESRLGKGKNMSIAKAALVVFYERLVPEQGYSAYIYSGDLSIAHDIVDIAGAKHCGPGTHWQVLKCLISSPYWEHSLWYINGWRNRRANCYHPSDIGKKYYEQKLKSHKYSSNLKDL